MKWYDYIALLLAAALTVYFFVGWLYRSSKWEEEKQAHRRHGGTAPKK